MAIRLDTRTADFTRQFLAFLDTKREASADVEAVVRGIVADVAARGDAALIDYTQKFDRLALDAAGLRVTMEEITRARAACRGEARPHRGVSPPPTAAERAL
jgi:histidinol dehydrogenase